MKKIIFLLLLGFTNQILFAQTINKSVATKTVTPTKKKKRVVKKQPIVTQEPVIENTEQQVIGEKRHPNPLPIAPMYKEGQQALIEFINANKKVPAEVTKNNVTVTVTVTFKVAIDGSLKEIKAVKADNFGCDSEAERIVRLMPKWTPGRVGRQFVEMPYAIDIEFK